ncbi:MAG TPA: hypothetical protein VH912_01420 [Streptosporangiaceae bacterium]|jgi:hypothetical protein
MSYDVYFLKRQPGQSWEATLEALEELEPLGESDEPPYSAEFTAAWRRIVAAARERLGDLTEFDYELDDEVTGIQLAGAPDECGLTVPYWHQGEEAERVMAHVFALAEVVERETGLEGYDPQLDKSISELTEADRRAAVERFAATSATMLR